MTQNAKSVLLLSADPQVEQALGSALAGIEGLKLTTKTETLAGLNGKAVDLAKGRDIVIFDTTADPEADVAAIRALRSVESNSAQLLALADSDIPLSRVRALSQAGVDEVLPRPIPAGELGAHVRRLLEAAEIAEAAQRGAAQSLRKGRVIAVAPARGGVGATTVAVNLAYDLVSSKSFLKKAVQHRVALLDLDLQFGSVGSMLDLPDQNALHQLALDGTQPDEIFLDSSLATLPNGLRVLAAPSKFMPLDSLSAQQIAAVLDLLIASTDFLIVDLPRALGTWMEPVLKRADELIIVSDASVPAVRHCRRLIDFFTADNADLPVRVVMNREKTGLFHGRAQREVQKALDRPLEHWLPDDVSAATRSTDSGKPLAQIAPRSPLGKAIANLARTTAATLSPTTTARRS